MIGELFDVFVGRWFLRHALRLKEVHRGSSEWGSGKHTPNVEVLSVERPPCDNIQSKERDSQEGSCEVHVGY